MPISYTRLVTEWSRVFDVTNNLAEVVANIKQRMEGRGISPAEAPIVMAKLQQVETVLRQIGANKEELVPADFQKIEVPLDIK